MHSLKNLATSWLEASKSKTIAPEMLSSTIEQLRNEGKTIATLNGSFDLMHAGHLHMIYEASKQADILVVALNTDQSIEQYKSSSRPIIPLGYRTQMMTALSFVDLVTWFDETDPRAILQKIKPDVHVNGSEYGEDCVEAETVKAGGGKIHIVKLIPGLSTSEIIKKIQG